MALAQREIRAGPGASLRSRRAVRQRRLHAIAQGPRHPHQHVAQRQSLGQCRVRIVHENAEIRRGLPQRISRSGRGPGRASASSWKRSTTKNACTRRSATCPRPSSSASCGRKPTRRPLRGSFPYEFSQAWGNLSSDGGAQPLRDRALAHRHDEFPAGYSLAGCAPAEPASASPAGPQSAVKSSCRSMDFQRTANSVLTVCLSPGGKRNQKRAALWCKTR